TAAPRTIDSGAMLFTSASGSGPAAPVISGDGTIRVNGETIIHVQGAGATYRIEAPISATSLTKSGDANLVLARANDIPGGVVINTATLTSAVPGALGTGTIRLAGGTLAIGGAAQSYGTLVVDGSLNHVNGSIATSYGGISN